jgi:CheY-like chemotaxis protein
VCAAVHITRARLAQRAIDSGADEIEHMPSTALSDDVIRRAVAADVLWVPTLKLWHVVGKEALSKVMGDRAPMFFTKRAIANLRRFLAAGGRVALGTDYGGSDGEVNRMFETGSLAGTFQLGLPMLEMELMQKAGMTPLQVLVAATKNGAFACGKSEELGTIEPGKSADVIVSVVDDGPGVPLEIRERIFDPFFTTKFTGRGLGLAAVQGIVLRHGGAIAVNSLPGTGTVFRVFLPAAGPAGSAAAQTGAASRTIPWRGKGTVLVVDDEEAVRTMASRMLRAIGFETVTASDGADALALIGERGESVQAVLLDLTMPRMDGCATFLELRRLRADLPVILSSGYEMLGGEERFPGLDFSGFLHKPYRIAELTEVMRRALGG